MTCAELNELFELYALGALEGEERDAVEEHLGRNCDVCVPRFHRATDLNAQLFRAVPVLEPSKELRNRVLAGFGVETRPFWARALPWSLAAVSAAILAMALIPRAIRETPGEMAIVAPPVVPAPAVQALEFLGLPGTRQVSFGTGLNAPHGSLLVQQERGLLLVVVNLPTEPTGKMYETWIVPQQGAPQAKGQLRAATTGESVALIPGPFNPATVKAVAVSLETASPTAPAAPTQVLFAAALN